MLKKIFLSKIELNTFYNSLKFKSNGFEKHIFIACLPKSGSTFLAKVITELTGFEFVQFQPIRGTNEHNIDKGVLFSNLHKNTVTQLHTKPSLSNKKLLKSNNIKVVFLYRGILNSLRSLHHHILHENEQWFMFTWTQDFHFWDEEKQFDFIIDLILPWYINFLTSWHNEIKTGDLEILSLDYDDFKSDNTSTVNQIVEFYNLNNTENEINLALNKAYEKKDQLRFNDSKDKKHYNFSKVQIKKIEKLVNYYPQLSIKI
jgi:hypothetical protein